MNLLKRLTKPINVEHCKCPHIICSFRKPNDDDNYEYGNIWVFINKDNNQYEEVYCQLSVDSKKPLWIKFKKEVNEIKKRNA